MNHVGGTASRLVSPGVVLIFLISALVIVLAPLGVAHAQQETAIMIESMNDILAKATEYRDLVAMRAIAHEVSAEWHRSRGVWLGVVATAI